MTGTAGGAGGLRGKRVTVMGLGQFGGGLGVTRWLVSCGATVLLTDRDPEAKLAAPLAQLAPELASGTVTLRLGGHDERDFAGADLVVSAGGTMNREAVVLGTPVWTTFAGELGAVDRALIAAGRLRRLERVGDLVVEPRGPADRPVLRDPALLVDLALSGLR